MEAHSAYLQHPAVNPEHQEWVAAYLDGQYLLADPEAMKRLKDMDNEIEK